MRTGFRGGWLEENGKVIGISLGSDYCAEHEWGIGDLKRALGIDGLKPEFPEKKVQYLKSPGLPRRMISRHDVVRLYEHKGAAVLICEEPWWIKGFEEAIEKNGIAKAFKNRLPRDLPQNDLGTAWSDDDFGIHGRGINAERIKDLYAEFQKNNVAIWIGGAKVFDNGGLIICIADRIPPANVQMLLDADLDHDKLTAASEATGIIERLKKGEKTFYACSPRWLTDKTRQSAHPVIYWLNPMEQQINNHGWFTVEELDQWIAGTGPIPMKEKTS